MPLICEQHRATSTAQCSMTTFATHLSAQSSVRRRVRTHTCAADIDISFVYRLFAPKLLCEVFNYQLALVDSLDTNWLRPWVLLTGQYKKCNDFDERCVGTRAV
jgi:hypothetical protein